MATIEQLEKQVKEQEKQIKTLKQAILRLERNLRSVSTVANRSQGQVRGAHEQIKIINARLKKNG